MEVLEAELARVQTALTHLQRSNAELAEAAAPGAAWEGGADVLLALKENTAVIARQQARVRQLNAAIAATQKDRLGAAAAEVLDVGHAAPTVAVLIAQDVTPVVVTTRPVAEATVRGPNANGDGDAGGDGDANGNGDGDRDGIYL